MLGRKLHYQVGGVLFVHIAPQGFLGICVILFGGWRVLTAKVVQCKHLRGGARLESINLPANKQANYIVSVLFVESNVSMEGCIDSSYTP